VSSVHDGASAGGRSPGDPELRGRAEAELDRRGRPAAPDAPEDLEALLNELSVHQIELEMQNEQLLETQLELEAAHARYYDLWDLAPIGYVTLDAEGAILQANLAAGRLLGAERIDLTGRLISAFVHPQSQDAYYLFWRGLDRPRQDGVSGEASVEVRLRAPQAQDERWASLTASSAFAAEGGSTARRVVLADVTEVLQAENQLRLSEARAVELFSHSPIALLDIDAAGIAERLEQLASDEAVRRRLSVEMESLWALAGLLRVAGANAAALELFGVQSVEALEYALVGSLTAETQEVMATIVRGLMAEAPSLEAAATIVRPDGDVRSTELLVTLLPGESGRRDHAVASFVDVTGRERAEEEVRRLNSGLRRQVVDRTAQLDAANYEVETLAYSLAHDLRTPLRTIDGFTASIMETSLPELGEDGAADLRRVRAATQTLARLLDDLLELSQLSRRPIHRETVDLTALAEAVGQEAAARSSARAVELTVARGLEVRADRILARRILRELIDNAWKFTAPNARAHVEVGALDFGEDTVLYVRDDGVGFDMRYAEHLFGAFQRMHPAEMFSGDGIGLATVQRLVRRHGGRCWAESEPRKGTTVFFTLPSDERSDP
jgi:PAS domain S-box-containing protein